MLYLNVVNPSPQYHTGGENYLRPPILFFIGCSCRTELESENKTIWSFHYWECIPTILLPKISTALKNTLRDHFFTLLFCVLVTTVLGRQWSMYHTWKSTAQKHLCMSCLKKKSAVSLHPELYLVYLDFISELVGTRIEQIFSMSVTWHWITGIPRYTSH